MTNIDRWLRLFLAIARHASVSRAAKELELTQSALRRQLACLEAYLGHPLFERHGRGMELTEPSRCTRSRSRANRLGHATPDAPSIAPLPARPARPGRRNRNAAA